MDSCVFPFELISKIIDNLHDDIDTLRACATLCHALVITCRKHIFSTIIIHVYPKFVPAQKRCLSVLKGSPEICAAVKRLVISTPGGLTISIEKYAPLLCDIMECLTHVQIFEVLLKSSWNRLPDRLCTDLYRIFKLPTLVDFTLSGSLDMPLEIFTAFRNLKYLRFSGHMVLEPTPGSTIPDNLERVKLETLRVTLHERDVDLIVKSQKFPFDFSQLTSLSFTGYDPLPGLEDITKQCAQSLTDLSFSYLGSRAPEVKLPHLFALKNLKIRLQLYNADKTQNKTENLVGILKTLPINGQLENIELILPVDYFWQFRLINWSAFDSALCRLKRLRNVRLVTYSHQVTTDKVIFILARELPMIYRRCAVKFVVAEEHLEFGSDAIDPEISALYDSINMYTWTNGNFEPEMPEL